MYMAVLSSSSSCRNWVFDVFPSFSGADVRTTFFSHLLKELNREMINTFIDNEIERSQSLEPELKLAIRTSKIAVVVFSEKYAASNWCLNELMEIVKCKEEIGQMVIPIFYHLDPFHVMKQTGDFGKIFKKTCKKNKTKEVNDRWKEALTVVANLAGFHFQNWDNEATFIERIVDDVLRKLSSFFDRDYFDHFVGMEDHITKMSLLLDLESEEVKMVGIWGTSGIGKTTIARALYSRLSCRFQGNVFIDQSFISECKRSYRQANTDDYNMKLHLQGKFLSELLNKKGIAVNHLGAVKEKLRHQKVLIVIDDLDDLVVLDALVGETRWFGIGSRIIVVTKDKGLLDAHQINCIYEVDLPSEDLALEMFCINAFSKKSPPQGFEKMAVEISRLAGRLPLGLKVLVSHLRGKDKEEWMDVFPTLQKRMDGKIESVLRFSYDGLSSKDQAIFRHIACFFNLEKVNDIKLLLDDSGLDIDNGLINLVEKSLIHKRSNIVEMHTLLQKLGKEIVYYQSNQPGKREFLMNSRDICQVFEENSGTENVIGISLDIDEMDEDLYIPEDAFKTMCNLRFLTIFSSKYMLEKNFRLHLPDTFDHLPPKLKLLCWDGYPMKSLPSNFRPEKLVKLKMKNSNLKKLWEGTRKLTCLHEINLWGSENLKDIPDLSRATKLERLYLGYCLSWVQHPSSIQKFDELRKLGMLECINMETLRSDTNHESPKGLILRERSDLCLANPHDRIQASIRMVTMLLASLKVLFLTDILNMVELPFSIQNLNKLTDLRVSRCTNLVTLPNGINLESLERINLNGCSRLKTFPDISRNILSLYLEETAIEEVPMWIEKFSKLKYLIMQRCSKLEYVYLNTSKLKHLELVNFSYCGSLTGVDLTSHANASGLALEADNIDTEEASSSSSLPENYISKVDFSFINCFNLDQKALLQQPLFEKLILSREEMPPFYFTHQTTRTSMAIPLLHTPPCFRFRVCAMVAFNSKPTFGAIGVYMKVNCRFRGRLGNHFDFPPQQEYFSVYQEGSYLLLLECVIPLNKDNDPLAEVNYDLVDIQLHMSNSKLKLKEWGIRRLSDDFSSSTNQLGNPKTLPQICEADVENDGSHEIEQGGGSSRDSEKPEVNTNTDKY